MQQPLQLCFALLCFGCFFLAVIWSCWSVKSGLLRRGDKKEFDPKLQRQGGSQVWRRKNAIGNFANHRRCLRRNDGHGHVQEAHSGEQPVVGLISSPCSLFYLFVFIHLFYIFWI
jgi:hypothetical protein